MLSLICCCVSLSCPVDTTVSSMSVWTCPEQSVCATAPSVSGTMFWLQHVVDVTVVVSVDDACAKNVVVSDATRRTTMATTMSKKFLVVVAVPPVNAVETADFGIIVCTTRNRKGCCAYTSNV